MDSNNMDLDELNFGELLRQKSNQQILQYETLQKLKQNTVYTFIFAIVFVVMYITLFIIYPVWQVRLCLGMLMLFSGWTGLSAWKLYSKVNPNLEVGNSLLGELKRQYRLIDNWMSINQRVGLFFYPISVAGGFMLGGVIGSGESVELLFTKPKLWLILVACIIIFEPLGYYFSKWMFKVSYGKEMKLLKKDIDELESEA